MNEILLLKGVFDGKNNPSRVGPPTLGSNALVYVSHLKKLYDEIQSIIEQYKNHNMYTKDMLISVYYNKVAAKSNRTTVFMNEKSVSSNQTIVGAKFSDTNCHIITHYVTTNSVLKSLDNLGKAISIAEYYFANPINPTEFNNQKKFDEIPFKELGIPKTTFQKLIVDCSYIERFGIENAKYAPTKDSVVTFYRTEVGAEEILKKFNIKIMRSVDFLTVVLSKEQIELLLESAPHLVSMAVDDLATYSPMDFDQSRSLVKMEIKDPNNEPTIGVIDTLFDDTVYFRKWVEYHELVDEIIVEDKDKKHGTRVSSIIVDGPRLNPKFDDGCGYFKVKHFGVAKAGRSSSVTIMKQIRNIVIANPDIRVWNLSLGSEDEVSRNFISIEAESLDRLQFEHNVVFIVSGTNDDTGASRKIGAPADSINALVINSVDEKKKPAKYSRTGPVLEFFTKPDLSYYGGTAENPLRVFDGDGEALVTGTSYAAPWIARKMAYLIEVLGFNREIAKALLIDAAIGWSKKSDCAIGYGIVPIHINDIIKTRKDEIRFVLSDVSFKYNVYNYRFPIPFEKGEYPFIARATLCYFPQCSRSQGVDYTNTELDLYFGRIDDNEKIKTINKNKQSLDEGPVTEAVGRNKFDKWNNVKNLQEDLKDKQRGRKVYSSKRWGMGIISKNRLDSTNRNNTRFGVVVTLREINGLNRIDEFIQMFSLNGWIVNRINVEQQIDIYQKAEEDIEFD